MTFILNFQHIQRTIQPIYDSEKYLAGRFVPANLDNYSENNRLYIIGNDAKETVDPFKDTSHDLFCSFAQK